jgi:hypothetical protein
VRFNPNLYNCGKVICHCSVTNSATVKLLRCLLVVTVSIWKELGVCNGSVQHSLWCTGPAGWSCS